MLQFHWALRRRVRDREARRNSRLVGFRRVNYRAWWRRIARKKYNTPDRGSTRWFFRRSALGRTIRGEARPGVLYMYYMCDIYWRAAAARGSEAAEPSGTPTAFLRPRSGSERCRCLVPSARSFANLTLGPPRCPPAEVPNLHSFFMPALGIICVPFLFFYFSFFFFSPPMPLPKKRQEFLEIAPLRSSLVALFIFVWIFFSVFFFCFSLLLPVEAISSVGDVN